MSIASSLPRWSWRRTSFATALFVATALVGCATPPTDLAARAAYEQSNDPLEPLNRKTFALNQSLDKWFFKPTAQAYVAVLPGDARKAVHHMLDNMKEPTLFFNNLLQGQFERASITLGRFVVNTTVGFGGMVDVMTLSGVERQPADFGQTLYVWGVPSGPYLILPILGPTNPRDAVGSAVNSYDDPFTILANDHGVTELTTARFVVGGIEERASVLDELEFAGKELGRFLRRDAQPRAAASRGGAEEWQGPRRRTRSLYGSRQGGPGEARRGEVAAGAHRLPGASTGAHRRHGASAGALSGAHRFAEAPVGPRRQPVCSAAVRCSKSLTRASAPPCCSTLVNSERRAASWLIVPLR